MTAIVPAGVRPRWRRVDSHPRDLARGRPLHAPRRRAVRGLRGGAGRELAATTFVHPTFVQLTTPGPTASIRLRSHSTFPRVLSGRRRDPRLHQGLRVAPPTNPPRADDQAFEKTSDLMANERDAQGNMLCPVCREVIRDPNLRPFMGDERVHEKCWSSPYGQPRPTRPRAPGAGA